MVLGPFQFSKTIRARHLSVHRWNGRIFVLTGLIVGISALVMSFTMQSIGGVNQAAATILFGSFFLFAKQGVLHIRLREVTLHRQWMIRAFAIGLAVATIRPIVGIFFATGRFSGLTPRNFRHLLLDRICSASHRSGSLDSCHAASNHKNADDCFLTAPLPRLRSLRFLTWPISNAKRFIILNQFGPFGKDVERLPQRRATKANNHTFRHAQAENFHESIKNEEASYFVSFCSFVVMHFQRCSASAASDAAAHFLV